MVTATPPVPNPAKPPKPTEEMVRDGEREGPVLVERDHSQSAPDDAETRPPVMPTTVPNGD